MLTGAGHSCRSRDNGAMARVAKWLLAGVVALPFDVQGSTFPVYAAWRKHAPANPFVQAALKLAPTG